MAFKVIAHTKQYHISFAVCFPHGVKHEKRMLINATQPEELRVALVDGQSIYDFDIEQVGQERKKSNIYKARVSELNKAKAFVDFGSERHGFLPVKELNPVLNPDKQGKTSITDILTQGQEIIVQVEKEERGKQGSCSKYFYFFTWPLFGLNAKQS